MSNLTHRFKIGQKVRCRNINGKFYNGIVKEIHEKHIIVDIPGVSDYCWFGNGCNMDCVFPDYKLQTKTCINIYSDMNAWVGFCVVFGAYTDFTKAEEIVQKAYDDWWELPDAQFEPIADWISRRLTEIGIEHEIYFKNEEEEVN